MQCVATVEKTTPLTIHVSLRQDADATGPLLVPRVLEPLGTFVSMSIIDDAGEVAFETRPVKFTPKLAPSDARAYVELDPGYAWGRSFVLDRAALGAGTYELQVEFSNLSFQGPTDRHVGALACGTRLAFEMTP